MTANELLTQVAQLLTTSAHLSKQATRAERAGESVYAMRVEANAMRADAAQLAAIAQADALCRIADCMEALTDERTETVRLAEEVDRLKALVTPTPDDALQDIADRYSEALAENNRLDAANDKLLQRVKDLEKYATKLEFERGRTIKRIEELEELLAFIDARSPVADGTCDEPGITYSEACRREMDGGRND